MTCRIPARLVLATLALAPSISFSAEVTGRALDAAGAPVAGARVAWEAWRSDEDRLVDETRGASPAVLGEAKTDAEGRFRVVVEKPRADGVGPGISVRILPAALPAALLEGPFDSTEDAPLGDVFLPAAESASGVVVDPAGKPVSGAKVRATAGLGLDPDGPGFFAETVTGSDGAFSIPNAPAGPVALSVRAAGLVPFAEGRFQRRGRERIVLRGGGSVSGTVVDPAGKPAEGAFVAAGSVATRTDASGAFALTGVSSTAPALYALGKDDLAARQVPLRLEKQGTTKVSLRLSRAASVAGTVIDEKTRRPIPGARIAITAGGFSLRDEEESRRARTDAKGRFRVSGLPARSYSVRASKTDYLPVTMPGVVAAIGSPGTVSIALQKTAAITGKVVDEKGAGVAGARVRMPRDASLRSMIRGGPRAFLSQRPETRTGPDGAFRLAELPPGRNLTVEAALAGWVPAARHGLTLRSGEVVKDVSLVLKRGLEAKGRVLDSAGQPIAGAEVRVSRPESGGARVMIQMAAGPRERADATSGADGTFRVGGLEPGEYALTVSREGFAAKRVPSLSVGAPGPNEWPPVVLAAGVAIAGAVRNTKGEAVVSAQIFSFAEGPGPRQATTDTEGRFRLEGFTPERPAMINVSAEGYGTLQRRVTPPEENLSLVLTTAGAIRGRVEDAATKRAVTEFTASYVEGRGGFPGGMRIVMGGPSNEKSFQSADGTFELAGVPAGKWNVSVAAPGYRSAEVAGIEIAEAEVEEGVLVSLKKGGVVTGRVLDPRRGTGVPNATVTWSERTDPSGLGPAGMALSSLTGGNSSTATDADGRFRFEGLPAGKITLTAEHADYLEASRQIELDDDANVDLTLAVGGSIAGTVVGRDGRTPAAGAQVALDAQGSSSFRLGEENARADAAGNFLFEHLAPGRYRLSARSSAGATPWKEVVLAESQRLDGVLLEVAGGATVRGTVSGLPASRLAGIRVSASARDYQDDTVTDEGGRFLLRDVPAGPLRITAVTDFVSMRSTSKNVDVPEGGEVAVDVVFEGASRLAGRVVRGDKPLAGVFVTAIPDPPSGAASRSSSRTDEDGRYAIEGLADGEYQLSLFGQGVSYRTRYTVAGDTNGDVTLPAVAVAGTVTDASSGEAIEGAAIQIERRDEGGGFTQKSAASDSRGAFSIDDVDSGSWSLTARKDGYQLKTQPVTVGSASVEVDVSLARGQGLAVQAVDGLTGLPLRSLAVLASGPGGAAAYSGIVSLDREGKGEIPSLAPGSYQLWVHADGYATRSYSVAVPSGTLALALTPGGRVEIRSDAPVSGRIVDAAGGTYLLFPFRRDGRVTIPAPVASWERVAPGAYRLLVAGSSGEHTVPFNVSEGRTTTVEIR